LRIWSRDLIKVVLLAILACPRAFSDASNPPIEKRVESAFVFQFTKFIEWPSLEGPNFSICIVDDAELQSLMNEITRDKSISGHPIKIEAYNKSQISEKFDACEVLVLPKGRDHGVLDFLHQFKGKNTLVVTYGQDLAKEGAGINFYLSEDRLKFEINQGVLSKTSIRPSGQLLKLARLVN